MTSLAEPFGLYLVLTRPRVGYEGCAEAAVEEGVGVVQLRMKGEPRDAVAEMARRLRALTRGTQTRLIINDDVEVAVECGADGVHVGQKDTPANEARRRLPPGMWVGLSTHNAEQVAEAEVLAPDYIGIGPVFPTPTKSPPDPAVGTDGLRELLRRTSRPAVAIGGINETNLREVLTAGACNFAVVRAVCDAPRPREALRRLMDIWKQWGT